MSKRKVKSEKIYLSISGSLNKSIFFGSIMLFIISESDQITIIYFILDDKYLQNQKHSKALQ